MNSRAKSDSSQVLAKTLKDNLPALKRLAPKYLNLSRLMSLALEARQRNPLLAECSIESVVEFCKRCCEWGTDRVGAGGAWPVPFWNNKTKRYEMQAIPDWRLLIEKAKKAKAILHAMPDIVREGDKFSQTRGMNPSLVHEPILGSSAPVIAAYCVYTLPHGDKDFVVMSRAELDAIRNRSKAWQAYLKDPSKLCPWNTDPWEMYKKTVVKRAMKLFEGASVELTLLLDADHRVMGFDDEAELEPIAMPTPIEQSEVPAEKPSEAPETPTPQQTETTPPLRQPVIPVGECITDPQRKRLWAICKTQHVDEEALRMHLFERYGFKSTKEITKDAYDEIVSWASRGGQDEPK